MISYFHVRKYYNINYSIGPKSKLKVFACVIIHGYLHHDTYIIKKYK